MDKYAKAFVKASLVYLTVGTILGVVMVVWPDTRFMLTRVHTHLNLLGFMAMMIYGVGYHIVPRFMGRPVYSQRLGMSQVWLANITLVGLCLAWIWEALEGGTGHTLAIIFASGHGLSIILFVFNLWKSMAPQKSD